MTVPMTEPALVVDFGTATSSGALVADGRVRLLKEPLSGSYSWPSAVCQEEGRLLVGTAAERRKRTDPAAYRAEFKRDLGEHEPIPLGGRSYRPEELVAAVVSALRDRAVDLHHGPVRRLVLTVPASYGVGDPRSALMLDAGRRAGFAEVELLPEPVAAASAPLVGAAFGRGDLVLVYDFGGGTFDAALVRFAAGGRQSVLGHAALDDCGGRDVDALLHRHIRDTGGDDLATTLAPAGLSGAPALRLRLQLTDFVRSVKHQLSDAVEVEDYLTPLAPPSRVVRGDLSRLVGPAIARTVDCCRDLLRRCRLELDDVTAVLLVGGTSRMPIVAESVASILRRPIRRADDPELAVVQGAAKVAAAAEGRTREPAAGWPSGEGPLRWDLDGGFATVLRWLVRSGDRYAARAPLAVVRTADGVIWRLVAPPVEGTVVRCHAAVDDRVAAGDVLATVRSTPPPPPPLPDEEPPTTFDFAGLFGPPPAINPDGLSGWPRPHRQPTPVPPGLTLLTASRLMRRVPVHPHQPEHSLAFSPSGALLAVVDADGTTTIRRVVTDEVVTTVPPGGCKPRWVGFGANEDWFACGTETATEIRDTVTGKLLSTIEHEFPAERWWCSPSGRWVAVYRHAVGRSDVYDTATGKARLRIRGPWPILAFSPDGSLLVWQSAYEEAKLRHPLGGDVHQIKHAGLIRWVAFTADSSRFITAGGHEVRLWDAVTMRHLSTVTTHSDLVSASLSPGGTWLATIERGEPEPKLWDLSTGYELPGSSLIRPAHQVLFGPDGRCLAARGDDGVQLWAVAG